MFSHCPAMTDGAGHYCHCGPVKASLIICPVVTSYPLFTIGITRFIFLLWLCLSDRFWFWFPFFLFKIIICWSELFRFSSAVYVLLLLQLVFMTLEKFSWLFCRLYVWGLIFFLMIVTKRTTSNLVGNNFTDPQSQVSCSSNDEFTVVRIPKRTDKCGFLTIHNFSVYNEEIKVISPWRA